jgi:hypothetical protein
MIRSLALSALAVALVTVACGDPGGETPVDGPYGVLPGRVPPRPNLEPQPDAGDTDSSPPEDAGNGPEDAGIDAPEPPPEDSGDIDTGKPDDAGHDSGHDTGPPTPTWDDIFKNYVASGTPGGCGGCHGQSTASGAYTWLKEIGQIDGKASAMVTKDSDFSWFGGFMPPGGPTSEPDAVRDMKAWVAAGAVE